MSAASRAFERVQSFIHKMADRRKQRTQRRSRMSRRAAKAAMPSFGAWTGLDQLEQRVLLSHTVEPIIIQENFAAVNIHTAFSRLADFPDRLAAQHIDANDDNVGDLAPFAPQDADPSAVVAASGTDSDEHYQGIARSFGLGTPYIYDSRAGGNDNNTLRAGNINIIQLDSRDQDGERLGSNRLLEQDFQESGDAAGIPNDGANPPAGDRVIGNIAFNGNLQTSFDGQTQGSAAFGGYSHPGGIQTVGEVLAVALEQPLWHVINEGPSNDMDDVRDYFVSGAGATVLANLGIPPLSNATEARDLREIIALGPATRSDGTLLKDGNQTVLVSRQYGGGGKWGVRDLNQAPEGLIVFYETANDGGRPRLITDSNGDPITIIPSPEYIGGSVGSVGITKMPGGHFLVAITGKDNEQVLFYRSNKTDFFEPGFNFGAHTSTKVDIHRVKGGVLDTGQIEIDNANGVTYEFTQHYDVWDKNVDTLTHTAAADNNEDWPSGSATAVGGPNGYQALQLLTDEHGDIYMIGSRETEGGVSDIGDDKIGLFRVFGGAEDTAGPVSSGSVSLRMEFNEFHVSLSNQATFAHVGGVHITPTGELTYFAGSGYNSSEGCDGVPNCGDLNKFDESHRLRFQEFRDEDLTQYEAPVRGVVITTPYGIVSHTRDGNVLEVGNNEVTNGVLRVHAGDTASIRANVIQPFAEFYDNEDDGDSAARTERRLMEFPDEEAEPSPDPFKQTGAISNFGFFNDKTEYLNYWVPQGAVLSLYGDTNFSSSGESANLTAPGLLVDAFRNRGFANEREVPDDLSSGDDRISSARFRRLSTTGFVTMGSSDETLTTSEQLFTWTSESLTGQHSQVSLPNLKQQSFNFEFDGYGQQQVTLDYLPAGGFHSLTTPQQVNDALFGGAAIISDGDSFNDHTLLSFTVEVINPNPVIMGDENPNEFILRVNPNDSSLIDVFIDGNLHFSFNAADTESFTFQGLEGDDTLIVDFVNGNPIPTNGVSYEGGDQDAGGIGDQLIVQGNTGVNAFDTETYNYTNANDGNVQFINGTTSTITYTGLEPILNAGTPDDIIFNLTAGADPDVVVSDDGNANDGFSIIAGSTFENTTFANPTNSLTVNGGDGNDVITLDVLDAQFAATAINLNGQNGVDEISVLATPASALTTVTSPGNGRAAVGVAYPDRGTGVGTLANILGQVDLAGSFLDPHIDNSADTSNRTWTIDSPGANQSDLNVSGIGSTITWDGDVPFRMTVHAGDGDDDFVVDMAGGDALDPLPTTSLNLNAGGQNTADTLTVNGTGVTFDLVHHVLNNASDGRVDLEIGGEQRDIDYFGLDGEPIDDNLTGTTRRFTYGGVDNDVVLLSDLPGDNSLQMSAPATSQTVQFTPTGTTLMQVQLGFGDDEMTVQALNDADHIAPIQVDGFNGSDNLIIDYSQGVVHESITYDGGVGIPTDSDVLTVTGDPGAAITRETYRVGATEDAGVHSVDPDDSAGPGFQGALTGDENLVVFSNLEPIITDIPVTVLEIIMDGTGVGDADLIDVVNAVAINGAAALEVRDLSNTFESTFFANKTIARVMGNLGNDAIRSNYTTPAAGLNSLQLFGHLAPDVVGQPADDNSQDRFTLDATGPIATSFLGQGGSDFFHNAGFAPLSSNDFLLDDLQGTISIIGGETAGDIDVVNLQDAADLTADNVTLTSSQLAGYRTAADTINYTQVESFFYEGTQGNDTVDVLSTAAGTDYLLTGNGGDDTVTIGNESADFVVAANGALTSDGGSLDAILGPVNVSGEYNGAVGNDTLNIDDSGTAALDGGATIDTAAAFAFDFGPFAAAQTGDVTTLTGFAPASIRYYHDGLTAEPDARIETLNVLTSTDDDTVNVNATTATDITRIDLHTGDDANTLTINGDGLSADNLFMGNVGADRFVLNVTNDLGAASVFPLTSLEIRGDANPDAQNRDTLTINDASAAAREHEYDYLDPSAGQGALDINPVGGNGFAIPVNVRTMESILHNGDGSNNDSFRVSGTSDDDDLTVAPGINAAFAFLNGQSWTDPNDGDFFASLPGHAGGGSGPDLLLFGVAQTGLSVSGDGSTLGDQLFVVGSNEQPLVDPAATASLFDPIAGQAGPGVLIPGNGTGNGFDDIFVSDSLVTMTNRGFGVDYVDVNIDTPSFVQDPSQPEVPGLIVTGGFEANGSLAPFTPALQVADRFTANFSYNFALQINGGDPDPDADPADTIPPDGDRLEIQGDGDLNLFNDKTDPFNTTLTSTNPILGATSFDLHTTSIESTLATPGPTQTVNLIGDNNDPLIDQNDNFVVVGQDVDSLAAPIVYNHGVAPQDAFQPDADGDNEMSVTLNGSPQFDFRNVVNLNVYGFDIVTPDTNGDPQDVPVTADTSDDLDTLDLTPYSDDSATGWGVDTKYFEGVPAQNDGEQVDLQIFHGTPGVSEDIFIVPSGPDNGQLIVRNRVDGSIISITDYVNNTDFIINANDGSAGDTDRLFLMGTDGVTTNGTSGNEHVIADFTNAGTPAEPWVDVRDADTDEILYRLRVATNLDLIELHLDAGDDSVELNDNDTVALLVYGGAGNDVLDAEDSTGGVTLLGGSGNDRLIGGSGDDLLDGGAGRDDITSGDGVDVLRGGSESDILTINGGANNDVDGGTGEDILNVTSQVGGTFTVLKTDAHASVSNATVGTGFSGAAGIELIAVRSENDPDYVVRDLTGTPTHTVLLGVELHYQFTGGSATASVTTNSSQGTVVVDGTALDDQIDVSDRTVAFAGLPGILDITDPTVTLGWGQVVLGDTPGYASLTVNGLGGDDVIKAEPGIETSVPIVLDGGVGDDFLSADATLIGGLGNDTLEGGAGDDSLDGGAGDDVFVLGGTNLGGTDTVIGGAGTDTVLVTGTVGDDDIDVTANTDLTVDINAGGPTVIDGAASDFELIQVEAGAGVDDIDVVATTALVATTINAGDGADDVDLSGAGAAPSITVNGGEGDDDVNGEGIANDASRLFLNGGAGDDNLVGGDSPTGSALGDVLDGGDGNDRLEGGRGQDVFLGGSGDDLLVWVAGDGSDLMEGGAGNNDELQFIANDGDNRLEVFGGGLFGATANPAPNVFNANTLEDASRVIFALNSTAQDTAAVFVNTGDVENIDIDAAGGADEITTNNQADGANTNGNVIQLGTELSHTPLRSVDIDLGAADTADDVVDVHGLLTDDEIDATANNQAIDIAGLGYGVTVRGSEAANDTLALHGQDGDDDIKAEASTDGGVHTLIQVVLHGDDGDDLLSADVTAFGGAGDDTLIGAASDDVFDGGAGDDVFIGNGGTDTIVDGPGGDTILVEGTATADTITVEPNTVTPVDLDVTVNGVTTTYLNVVGGGASVEQVFIDALAGEDTINVEPLANVAVNVDGGNPIATNSTGDTLNIIDAPASITHIQGPEPDEGSFEAINGGPFGPVTYDHIENASVASGDATTDVVFGTNGDDHITVVQTGDGSLEVSVNGGPAIPFTGVSDLNIFALNGDDVIAVQTLDGTTDWNVNLNVFGGNPTASDIVILGTPGDDDVIYSPTAGTPDAGVIEVTNIAFVLAMAGVEHVTYDGENGEDDVTVNGTSGADRIEWTAGATVDAATVQVFEQVAPDEEPTLPFAYQNITQGATNLITLSPGDGGDLVEFIGTGADDLIGLTENAAGNPQMDLFPIDAFNGQYLGVEVDDLSVVVLDGRTGNDRFVIDAALVNNDIDIAGGESGDDLLDVLNDEDAAETFTVAHGDLLGEGTVTTVTGLDIDYIGLEQVSINPGLANNDALVVAVNASDDTGLTLTGGGEGDVVFGDNAIPVEVDDLDNFVQLTSLTVDTDQVIADTAQSLTVDLFSIDSAAVYTADTDAEDTLVVRGTTGDDTVTINATTIVGTGGATVNWQETELQRLVSAMLDGDDRTIVNGEREADITVNGADPSAGSDTVELNSDEASADFIVNHGAGHSGKVDFDGSEVVFNGVEDLELNAGDGAGADSLTVRGVDEAEAWTLIAEEDSGDGTVEVNDHADIDFNEFTDDDATAVNLDGAGGDDQFYAQHAEEWFIGQVNILGGGPTASDAVQLKLTDVDDTAIVDSIGIDSAEIEVTSPTGGGQTTTYNLVDVEHALVDGDPHVDGDRLEVRDSDARVIPANEVGAGTVIGTDALGQDLLAIDYTHFEDIEVVDTPGPDNIAQFVGTPGNEIVIVRANGTVDFINEFGDVNSVDVKTFNELVLDLRGGDDLVIIESITADIIPDGIRVLGGEGDGNDTVFLEGAGGGAQSVNIAPKDDAPLNGANNAVDGPAATLITGFGFPAQIETFGVETIHYDGDDDVAPGTPDDELTVNLGTGDQTARVSRSAEADADLVESTSLPNILFEDLDTFVITQLDSGNTDVTFVTRALSGAVATNYEAELGADDHLVIEGSNDEDDYTVVTPGGGDIMVVTDNVSGVVVSSGLAGGTLGRLRVNTLDGVDEILVIDAPAVPLTVDGGATTAGGPTGVSDTLSVLSTQDSSVFEFTPGDDPASGQILVDANIGQLEGIIDYEGIDHIILDAEDAIDINDEVTINATGGNDHVTVTAIADAGEAIVQVNDHADIFLTHFSSNDSILNIDTHEGDDVVSVQHAEDWLFGTVNIDAGAPTFSDLVQVLGTPSADTFNYTPTGSAAGTLVVTSPAAGINATTYNLTGVETFDVSGDAPVAVSGNAGDRLQINDNDAVIEPGFFPGTGTVRPTENVAGEALLAVTYIQFEDVEVVDTDLPGDPAQNKLALVQGTEGDDIITVGADGRVTVENELGDINTVDLKTFGGLVINSFGGNDLVLIENTDLFPLGVEVIGGESDSVPGNGGNDTSSGDTVIVEANARPNTIDLDGNTVSGIVGGLVTTRDVETLIVDGLNDVANDYDVLAYGASTDIVNLILDAQDTAGATDGDTVDVSATGGPDAMDYTPTSANSGVLEHADGPTIDVINFNNTAGALSLTGLGLPDSLAFHGSTENDTITVEPGGIGTSVSLVVGGVLWTPIDFDAIETLDVNGADGDDLFDVTPSTEVEMRINGGDPLAVLPGVGDDMIVRTGGDDVSFAPGTKADEGVFLVGDNEPISFTGIENATSDSSTININGNDNDNDIAVIATGPNSFRLVIDAEVDQEYTGVSVLNLDALGGDDDITIVTRPDWDVTVNVDGGLSDGTNLADTLVIQTPGSSAAAYTPAGNDSGTVVVTGLGGTINLDNIEALTYDGEEDGDVLTVNGTDAPDLIRFAPGGTIDSGNVQVNSLLPIDYEDLGATGSVDLNGGLGGDELAFVMTGGDDEVDVSTNVVSLTSLLGTHLPVNTSVIETLTLDGGNGDDTFNVDASHVYTLVNLEGGNPAIGSDTANLQGDGSAGTTQMGNDDGTATVTGNGLATVQLVGVELLNLDTAGGDLTVDITDSDDEVQVTPLGVNNGQLTANGVSPVLNYSSTGTFTVDTLGGVDRLEVNGSNAGDTITVTGALVNVAGREIVNYANVTTLDVRGHGGDDTFDVTPSAVETFIIGGIPIASLPGDHLTIQAGGQAVTFRPGPQNDDEGVFEVGDNAPVSYDQIESTDVIGGAILVTGTNFNDVITIVARDGSTHAGADGVNDFTVAVNDEAEILFTDVTNLIVNALDGDDQIVVVAEAPNEADWNVDVTIDAGLSLFGDTVLVQTPYDQTAADSVTFTPDTLLSGDLALNDTNPTNIRVENTEDLFYHGQDVNLRGAQGQQLVTDSLLVNSPNALIQPDEFPGAGSVLAVDVVSGFPRLGLDYSGVLNATVNGAASVIRLTDGSDDVRVTADGFVVVTNLFGNTNVTDVSDFDQLVLDLRSGGDSVVVENSSLFPLGIVIVGGDPVGTDNVTLHKGTAPGSESTIDLAAGTVTGIVAGPVELREVETLNVVGSDNVSDTFNVAGLGATTQLANVNLDAGEDGDSVGGASGADVVNVTATTVSDSIDFVPQSDNAAQLSSNRSHTLLNIVNFNNTPGSLNVDAAGNVDQINIHGSIGNDIIDLRRAGADSVAASVEVNGNAWTPVVATSFDHVNVLGHAGSDRLDVDNSAGLVDVSSGVNYDGGDGFDSLRLLGSTAVDTVDYTVGTDTTRGRVVHTAGTTVQTVEFSQLEPVIDIVEGALVINGNGSNNIVTYNSGPNSGSSLVGGLETGLLEIDNFETFEFGNKFTLTVSGAGGDDRLNFNNGDLPSDLLKLTLIGGHGDDLLVGSDQDDDLFGGSGDDVLRGKDGDDILDGGSGTNLLDGGNGIDSASLFTTEDPDLVIINFDGITVVPNFMGQIDNGEVVNEDDNGNPINLDAQPAAFKNIENVDIDTLGGDDTVIVNAGTEIATELLPREVVAGSGLILNEAPNSLGDPFFPLLLDIQLGADNDQIFVNFTNQAPDTVINVDGEAGTDLVQVMGLTGDDQFDITALPNVLFGDGVVNPTNHEDLKVLEGRRIDTDVKTVEPNRFLFTDKDGNATTVGIQGSGPNSRLDIFRDIATETGRAQDIDSLLIRDGNEVKTRINVRVTPKTGTDNETSIRRIEGDAAAYVTALKSDLLEKLDIDNGLRRLAFDDIADNAELTFGGNSGQRLVFTADTVGANVHLTTGNIINRLAVTGGWGPGGSVTASVINNLISRGDFGADLTNQRAAFDGFGIRNVRVVNGSLNSNIVTDRLGNIAVSNGDANINVTVISDAATLNRFGRRGLSAYGNIRVVNGDLLGQIATHEGTRDGRISAVRGSVSQFDTLSI